MFLDEFDKYRAHYVQGARSVLVRTSYPKLEKQPPYLKIKQSSINFDLFFSRDGILLSSIQNTENRKSKTVYSYDYRHRLVFALKVDIINNIIIELNDYKYNDQGFIKSEHSKSSYINSEFEDIRSCIYSYGNNTEEVLMTGNIENDSDCIIYRNYNNQGKVIEEKFIRKPDELVWWDRKEYDKSGDLLKDISLSEKGEIDCIYEYFPKYKGLATGFKCIDENKPYIREHKYIFNDKGHWINQSVMNDGVPHLYYDRTIDYF